MKPYVYVDRQGAGRTLDRPVPYGARVAVHFPDLGRCVELHVTPQGAWSVLEGPAAGHGGEFAEAANGRLAGRA